MYPWVYSFSAVDMIILADIRSFRFPKNKTKIPHGNVTGVCSLIFVDTP